MTPDTCLKDFFLNREMACGGQEWRQRGSWTGHTVVQARPAVLDRISSVHRAIGQVQLTFFGQGKSTKTDKIWEH